MRYMILLLSLLFLLLQLLRKWTEGGYLEPDTKNKMQYLDAFQDVFGRPGPGASAGRRCMI